MNLICISIIIFTAVALTRPPSCNAFLSSYSFAREHYRIPTSILNLHYNRLKPRWSLPLRRKNTTGEILVENNSYNLGLTPLKKYTKIATNESGKLMEEKVLLQLLEQEVNLNATKEKVREELPETGANSSLTNGLETRPNRSLPAAVQLNINASESIESNQTRSNSTSAQMQPPKAKIMTLAETISQSIHFFEDKQNLPKYSAPKKQMPSSKTTQPNEPALLKLSSFHFLDYFEKQNAPKTAVALPTDITRSVTPLSSVSRNTTISDPSAPLTLADLQLILNQNGYIRRDEIGTILSNPMEPQTGKNTTANRKETNSGVAFPQPSVTSNKHIKTGSMISSGFFGVLLLITIKPNLWLLGAVLGALYGGDIAEKAALVANTPAALPVLSAYGTVVPQPPNLIPGGLYGELTLKCGKKIATSYLSVWDFFQGVWFMYRTGQLSYEYYKTYAVFDKRFGVQTKMDAWNARFIEGKDNFDRWEKENEIGRKVLAGLRTAWMVEESSYNRQMYRKKGRTRSKYRIVQVGVDTLDWFRRLFRAGWRVLRGGKNDELNDIVKGVQMGLKQLNLEVISQRTGATIAALVAVNLVGALFAVAPYLLGLMAVVSGIIWPNWMGNTAKVINEVIDETRARGRGEEVQQKNRANPTRSKLPFVDKNSFSFYVGKDGKKRWYRTGQSYNIRTGSQENDDGSEFSISWPWKNRNDRTNSGSRKKNKNDRGSWRR